jgi:hypothetical protein
MASGSTLRDSSPIGDATQLKQQVSLPLQYSGRHHHLRSARHHVSAPTLCEIPSVAASQRLRHRRILGETVRTHRKRARISREKLAEKADLTPSTSGKSNRHHEHFRGRPRQDRPRPKSPSQRPHPRILTIAGSH